MIYLDGDIQVFDNIDHLFEKPTGYFYAVKDCFCEKTWSTSPQYQIKYCQQCPEKVQWPLEMGSPPPLYFNAGMFLYEPKLETYFDLLETLKVTTPTSFAEQVINLACLGYLLLLFFGRLSYIYTPLFFGYSRKEVVDFSFFNYFIITLIFFTCDLQDFLNMFFRDVFQPIPPVYNLVSAMLWRHPDKFDLDEVKVVHYCAAVREFTVISIVLSTY